MATKSGVKLELLRRHKSAPFSAKSSTTLLYPTQRKDFLEFI